MYYNTYTIQNLYILSRLYTRNRPINRRIKTTMIDMILNPVLDIANGAVCMVSDTVAGLTGVRCTRDTSGALPFAKQTAQRQQVIAASQRQPAPRRAGFATNFIARG